MNSRFLPAAGLALVAAAVLAVAIARPDASARDGGPVFVHAPARPAAWVEGTEPGTRLGLVSLRRSGPKVVTAKLRLSADKSVRRSIFDDRMDLDFLADDLADDVSGMRLVDELHGRAIAPMHDAVNACLCSSVDDVAPGGSVDLYAKFLVPAGVDRVALEVPTFPSFDGVVIAPR